MNPKEHVHGATSNQEQSVDRSLAQSHDVGRQDHGSVVADMVGEFGAELVRAIRAGLAQGTSPVHGPRGPSKLSWYAFATEYARAHWPGRAAKTRDEVSEALTAITMAMCWGMPGRPKGQLLRRALRHWAFVVPGPEQQELPAEDRLVLQWVAKASRPLVDLHDPVLARDVLESLRRKLDGGEAAVETLRRKRKVLVHALHYAVERGELGSHPLAGAQAGHRGGPASGGQPAPGAGAAGRRLLRGQLPQGPRPSAGRVLRRHVLRGSASGGGGRGGAAGLPSAPHRLGEADPAPYSAAGGQAVDRQRQVP